MAPSLNNAVNDMVKLLKKEKPSGSGETYWNILSIQLLEERSWDEDLLSSIKLEISKWLENQDDKTVKELWEKSETALEDYEEDHLPEIDTMIIDLKDELLDMVLERVEEENPKEEYLTDGDEEVFDLDDDDFDDEKFFNGDDIDSDLDDDFLDDDDRY